MSGSHPAAGSARGTSARLAGAAACSGAQTHGPGARAGLASALLPHAWTERQGLKMCLMCKVPKLRGQDEFPSALTSQSMQRDHWDFCVGA